MASQVQILGFVNDPHAAAAKLSQDAIMGDSFADH
jgi:hypothetical protein